MFAPTKFAIDVFFGDVFCRYIQ